MTSRYQASSCEPEGACEAYAREHGHGAKYLGVIDGYEIGDEIGDGAKAVSALEFPGTRSLRRVLP